MLSSSKNKFKDPRWHVFNQSVVLLVIAPYMYHVAQKHNDARLKFLAAGLFAFDLYSLLNRSDWEPFVGFTDVARLFAIVVQVPYMFYAARKYNDSVLFGLAMATLVADSYTLFWLKSKKKT